MMACSRDTFISDHLTVCNNPVLLSAVLVYSAAVRYMSDVPMSRVLSPAMTSIDCFPGLGRMFFTILAAPTKRVIKLIGHSKLLNCTIIVLKRSTLLRGYSRTTESLPFRALYLLLCLFSSHDSRLHVWICMMKHCGVAVQ